MCSEVGIIGAFPGFSLFPNFLSLTAYCKLHLKTTEATPTLGREHKETMYYTAFEIKWRWVGHVVSLDY